MSWINRLFSGSASRSGGTDDTRAGQADETRARGNDMATVYPSSSPTSTISRYRDPSPRDYITEQRRNRNIVRSMSVINPTVRSMLKAKVEIVVGDGPRPESRFKDLVTLWHASQPYFDNRDQYDHGMWLGEDVAWNFFVDGDVGVRRRDRRGTARAAGMRVMIQWQALKCDWMPDDYEGPSRFGPAFRNGLSIFNDEVLGYAVYSEHPGDAAKEGRTPKIDQLAKGEIYHLFQSSTGNPRGEVPLASIIDVAEDLDDLDSFERQRKKNSTAFATYLKKISGLDSRPDGGPS